MFGHNDGVVHDEANGENCSEQDDHIDGVPERPGKRHRGEEGGGDAGGHPQRRARVQEHEQHDQHDDQPADAVAHQQVDALVDQVRRRIVAVHRDAGRQGRHETVQEPVGGLGRFQRIRRRRPLDDEFDRRAAVEPDPRLVLVPGLAHLRNLAHRQPAPVRERPDLDRRDLLGRARKTERTHPRDRAPAGVAPRYVARGARDPARYFRYRKVEGQQVLLVRLDQDPFVAGADHLHFIDPGADQPVAHPGRPGLDRALRQVSGEHDAQQVLVAHDAPYPGRLAVLGQGRDAGHGRFHVRQRRLHVGARLENDPYVCETLLGVGDHPFHAVEETDLGLDGLDDGVVHILRAGARPGHGDEDHVDAEIGEELLVHPPERQQPDHQHRSHQQVRRRRVAREQRDQGTVTLTPEAISGKRVSTMR